MTLDITGFPHTHGQRWFTTPFALTLTTPPPPAGFCPTAGGGLRRHKRHFRWRLVYAAFFGSTAPGFLPTRFAGSGSLRLGSLSSRCIFFTVRRFRLVGARVDYTHLRPHDNAVLDNTARYGFRCGCSCRAMTLVLLFLVVVGFCISRAVCSSTPPICQFPPPPVRHHHHNYHHQVLFYIHHSPPLFVNAVRPFATTRHTPGLDAVRFGWLCGWFIGSVGSA